ncbi:MAG TPA: FAD-dependent oxidoreductase, partial [Candidatus Scatomorpha intestinavium]|nr:FAD-dependent oxidoreductase [Candidatus Scatomorpha intestinavium]
MKIIVIGAVAAGTKAAAKIKRELGNGAEVLVITRERDISYAGCGLPYYIGGVIEDRSELLQNTPESFAGLTGVTMRCG